MVINHSCFCGSAQWSPCDIKYPSVCPSIHLSDGRSFDNQHSSQLSTNDRNTPEATPWNFPRIINLIRWVERCKALEWITGCIHFPKTWLMHLCCLVSSVVLTYSRWTGIAATELPPRVHLGLELSGPLCAAILFRPSSPEALYVKRHQRHLGEERNWARNVRII
jgi:hypothetical protein